MGILSSRPKAHRHPSIVRPVDYIGLPVPTVLATLRGKGISVHAVAVKPDERYMPGSAQVSAGTLLVIYNGENDYVTEVRYAP
jgi:hypothetical protein